MDEYESYSEKEHQKYLTELSHIKNPKRDFTADPHPIKEEILRKISSDGNYIAPLEAGLVGETGVNLNGYIINIDNGPACIRKDARFSFQDCEWCDFFIPKECLLRNDEFLMDEINRLVILRTSRVEARNENRQKIIDALHHELQMHGKPLHFSILADILAHRYPEFHLKPKSVDRLLNWNSHLFERVDRGVYNAR